MAFIVLTMIVEPEGEMFVSKCAELGTASCGDTIQEAIENLEDAITVHLNALVEIGETGRVFDECGIEIRSTPLDEPVPRTVPVDTLMKVAHREVLVPA
jgi:predicted RNase H-like HicB family nuclease